MRNQIGRAIALAVGSLALAACQTQGGSAGPDAGQAQQTAAQQAGAQQAGAATEKRSAGTATRPYAPAGTNGATVVIRPEGDVIIAAVGGNPVRRDDRGTLITAKPAGDEFGSLMLPPGSHDLTLGMLGSAADMVDVSIDAKPGDYIFTVLDAKAGDRSVRILAVIEGGADGMIVASSEPLLVGRTRAEAMAVIAASPAERKQMLAKESPADGNSADKAKLSFRQGRQYLAQNQLEQAVASFDDAIAAAPDFGAAHMLRGIALLQLSRPEDALAAIDKSIDIGTRKLGPNSEALAEPFYLRGAALSLMGRPEEALAALDRSLAVKPTAESYNARAQMYFTRGEDLLGRGRASEASASFEKARADADAGIALVPNSVALWSIKSGAQFMLQQVGPACESARKACTFGNCSILEAKPECRPGS